MNRVKKIAISDNISSVLEMLSRQNFTGMVSHTCEIGGLFIGWLGGPSVINTENMLIFAGEPINGPDLSNINNYEDAVRLLPDFDGAFNAFYFDRVNQKFVIVSDFLGLQPLYINKNGGSILLASETKAFGLQKRDMAGWGAFYAWGHLIADRTLLEEVRRFPAATVFVYDLQTGRENYRLYWNFPEENLKYNIIDIVESFKMTVESYSSLAKDSTLLVSGGLDSRFIFYVLKEIDILDDILYVEHKDEYGDLEGYIAKTLLRKYGEDYNKSYPPLNFYSSKNYLDYLSLMDASTPSLYLFISKLIYALKNISTDSLWDGFVTGHVLKSPDYLSKINNVSEYLINLGILDEDSNMWTLLRNMFNSPFSEAMYEAHKAELEEECLKYEKKELSISQFKLNNRGRHRIAMNPLQVYSNFSRPFLPGLSKDFFNRTMSIPANIKKSHKLYFSIFDKVYPDACNVPYVSGGSLVSTKRNISFYTAKIRMDISKFNYHHPRLSKLLGFYRNNYVSSDFLNSSLLLDDPAINYDFFKKIEPSDPNYAIAWKVLFHWRVWELVHKGEIYNLLSNTDTEDGSL